MNKLSTCVSAVLVVLYLKIREFITNAEITLPRLGFFFFYLKLEKVGQTYVGRCYNCHALNDSCVNNMYF